MDSGSAASTLLAEDHLSALNDDILCELFNIMSDIDPPRSRTNEIIAPREVRFRLGWIYLTHVNQRWRRLLLSMRSLWAKIFSVMPESALDQTLSRAGDAPLHITLDNNRYSQRYKRLTALALSEMERVSVLYNPAYFDWYPGLHDRSLPQLVTLDIIQSPRPVLNLLLKCPNLRDCTLDGMPAVVSAPYLRRLVVHHSLPSPAQHFLDMLANLPLLEELEVSLTTKEPIKWGNGDCPTVELAQLRSIDLSGTKHSDMIGFWRKLSVPDSMHDLRIAYRGNTGWGSIVDAFMPYLVHELYDALAFQQGRGDLFKLCAFALDTSNPAALDPGVYHPGASVQIVPEFDSDGENSGDEGAEADGELLILQILIPRMLSHLEASAEHIKHISFDTFSKFDLHDELEDDPDFQPRAELRYGLYPFTSVTSVSGRFSDFDFGVLAISDDEEEEESEDEDEDDYPLFPKLTTVVGRIDSMNSGEASIKSHWKELNAVFENRAQADVPIRRLEFIGSMLPSRRNQVEVETAMTEGLRIARTFGLVEFVDRRETLQALMRWTRAESLTKTNNTRPRRDSARALE